MLKQLCIVLRAVHYKDYDKILTLFSRTQGKISAQARGVRRIKSGLATASQPFCCAEYEFYQKSERLYVTGALVKEEFYHIQNQYEYYTAACVMLELTDKILEHTIENERLFIVLINTLYSMEKHGLAAQAALLYYVVHAVEALGISPALSFCVNCGRPIDELKHWNAVEGGGVCGTCAEQMQTKTTPAGFDKVYRYLQALRPKETEALDLAGINIAAYLKLLEEYLLLAGDIDLKTMRYL